MIPGVEQVAALFAQGRLAEARQLLETLVGKRPRDVQVRGYLAIILRELGDFDNAVVHARRATELAPRDPNSRVWLGNALGSKGLHAEALQQFVRAVALDAHCAEAWVGRILSLRFSGNVADAAAAGTRAVALCPHSEQVAATCASALLAAGDAMEAREVARDALAKFPDSTELASVLAGASNYPSEIDAEEAFAAQQAYGRALLRRCPARSVPYQQSPNQDRRLRVALISSDLREHSVSHFIGPLLKHIDRAECEMWCYSTTLYPDAVSTRLSHLADRWSDVSRLSDLQLAQKIYDERIDVLIDLHGNTIGHRLGVLANTPAPVQVTYCGYPHSTGVRGIQWRVVDETTDPPGVADERATETLLRLPGCFLCYEPSAELPDPTRTEADGVVFGSFNMLSKLSSATLDLWSGVLAAVPGSRLTLKATALRDPAVGAALIERCVRAGIPATRVEILPPTATAAEHLALYKTVDIALDTTPYNGTTTTCESLVMGVPVVALLGDRHSSRVSASLLKAAGRPDWIAASTAEYIALAQRLAGDLPRVRSGRAGLRQAVLASQLCDAARFAPAFADAIRTIWVQWCRSRENRI